MIKLNIKSSNSIMSYKQFKLYYLITEFSKFLTIEYNTIIYLKKNHYSFLYKNIYKIKKYLILN